MKNICLKSLIIILIIIVTLFTFQNKANAFGDVLDTVSDTAKQEAEKQKQEEEKQKQEQMEYKMSVEGMLDSATGFLDEGKDANYLTQEEMQTVVDTIYNVLLSICIVAALIMGIFIGIKFMTGSVEEQAQVKETLIPYIVGCSIAFGAFGIWKIMMEIINLIP